MTEKQHGGARPNAGAPPSDKTIARALELLERRLMHQRKRPFDPDAARRLREIAAKIGVETEQGAMN